MIDRLGQMGKSSIAPWKSPGIWGTIVSTKNGKHLPKAMLDDLMPNI